MPIGMSLDQQPAHQNPADGLTNIEIVKDHDAKLWSVQIVGQTTREDIEEANRRVKKLNERDRSV